MEGKISLFVIPCRPISQFLIFSPLFFPFLSRLLFFLLFSLSLSFSAEGACVEETVGCSWVVLNLDSQNAKYTNTEDQNLGEQGWRSGESARLPPMWPGFDSRSRCHIWVEFVVGSRLCSERFFSGNSSFPLSSKTNISKFQFDLEPEGHRFVSPRLLCVTLVRQS